MKGYRAYHKTSVQTADRIQVIVMLYEKAISQLNRATIEVEEKNEGCEWSQRLNKALEIIKHLSSALDFEQGGEIAVNLSALYDYIRDIINEGHISRDTKYFKEAAALLSELLEGWRGIADEQSPGRNPNPAAPAPPNPAQRMVRNATPLPDLGGAKTLTELIA